MSNTTTTQAILEKFASDHDAYIIHGRGPNMGLIAICARHYLDGIPQVRYYPDNCDFKRVQWWLENIHRGADILR